jgi:hypothetical protein
MTSSSHHALNAAPNIRGIADSGGLLDMRIERTFLPFPLVS